MSLTVLFLHACSSLTVPASRRQVLVAAVAGVSTLPSCASTAMDDSQALSPKNGLFTDCPAEDTCVSSQDDRPQSWDNPWISEGALADAMAKLRYAVEERFNGRILAADDRYLRVEFSDRSMLGTSLDVCEFFFTPNDDLVQFRSERVGGRLTDLGANRKRLERVRISLGWEKVPVLRNRRRALVVVGARHVQHQSSQRHRSVRPCDAS